MRTLKMPQTSPLAAYLLYRSQQVPPEWLTRPDDPNTPDIDESGTIYAPPRIDSDPGAYFWTVPDDAVVVGVMHLDGTILDATLITEVGDGPENDYERGKPIMMAEAKAKGLTAA